MSDFTRRTLLAGAALAPASAEAQAQQRAAAARRGGVPGQHILASRFTAQALEKNLLARDRWHPYATWSDRAAWSALPAAAGDAVRKAAAAWDGKPYPLLPATVLLEFARNGNRSHYEDIDFGRRSHVRTLVLAECVEGKGRLLDQIVDGVWAICEETFWGVPAHLGAQKRGVGLPDAGEPIIDLFAAETAAGLAWIDYLIGPQLDTVNKLIRERIEEEIERRILAVYRAREDFGWMGLANPNPVNNWNPWINSNVLTCALLIDRDSARRAQTVHKILTSVDRFLDGYHPDGGCDEGPGYWSRAGASLFECLDLLRSASSGAVNYFDVPLVRQIGAYIYRVQIAGDWYVNFADAAARVHPDADLVYRFGKAAGDGLMAGFGAWLARGRGPGLESFGRALPALFGYEELRRAEAHDPLLREAWMPGIQVAAARMKTGSAEGLYFAAQGGHNAESHNHNDVGNFIVYAGGEPVLIDIGVETYTARTFSSHRYEIWTMQSAYHNLPTINGVMQGAGRQYAARDVGFTSDDAAAEFAAEIAAAYPKDARVQGWRRAIRLDRARNEVAVTDRYALEAPGKIEMSLMTPCVVRQEGGGLVFEGRAKLAITGPAAPAIHVEDIPIKDARLRGSWGTMLRRVLLTWEKAPAAGEIVMRVS
jgi:hypothetical protein